MLGKGDNLSLVTYYFSKQQKVLLLKERVFQIIMSNIGKAVFDTERCLLGRYPCTLYTVFTLPF